MSEALGPSPMTPRRRTAILAGCTLVTAAILASASYLGYQVTIGGYRSDVFCSVYPDSPKSYLPLRDAGYGYVRKWRWWPPGYHEFKCWYQLPNGTTVIREPPPSPK